MTTFRRSTSLLLVTAIIVAIVTSDVAKTSTALISPAASSFFSVEKCCVPWKAQQPRWRRVGWCGNDAPTRLGSTSSTDNSAAAPPLVVMEEPRPQAPDGITELLERDAWESTTMASRPYISTLLRQMDKLEVERFLTETLNPEVDALWEQIQLEAKSKLGPEPQAGPQLYQNILSQTSLLEAIVTTIANEIATELIPATALRNLFLDFLTPPDKRSIQLDIMATAMRSPSVGTALNAILFHKGLHALVCYRVGHRLWEASRTGLAYYMQSVVSSQYSADIHPAAQMGAGLFLNCGGGVVIGETAVVGDDVTILQGVTLGGTGKERGNRHPKVANGVILHAGATVLGNIRLGEGAVITAKSIVTKPVPPLARVSGVPARVRSYRNETCGSRLTSTEHVSLHQLNATLAAQNRYNDEDEYATENASGVSYDRLEEELAYRFLQQWKDL